MSNENSPLLEEYKELGLSWRHDSESFSKLTAVLLPLSIAALTLPYLKAGTPKLLATVGGLMLMTFWFFSSLAYENRYWLLLRISATTPTCLKNRRRASCPAFNTFAVIALCFYMSLDLISGGRGCTK